jgi:ABC-type uncharacterized transport system substrate-binding protein
MKKAGFLSILVVLVQLAFGVVTEAQQPVKVPKIEWLGTGAASSVSRYEEFRQALRTLGYVEGKNIIIESRSAEGKLDRLPALADELVRLKVDVLVTSAAPGTLAARNATRTNPIVFHNVVDPVEAGLVDSLARCRRSRRVPRRPLAFSMGPSRQFRVCVGRGLSVHHHRPAGAWKEEFIGAKCSRNLR